MLPASERNIYTVTRLNREVRLLLERGLSLIWLEAELSNFTQPASGHWYFTLKDKEAQIRGAMFRQRNMSLGFTPKSLALYSVDDNVTNIYMYTGSNCTGTMYNRYTGTGTVHNINLDTVGIGSNLVSYKITW